MFCQRENEALHGLLSTAEAKLSAQQQQRADTLALVNEKHNLALGEAAQRLQAAQSTCDTTQTALEEEQAAHAATSARLEEVEKKRSAAEVSCARLRDALAAKEEQRVVQEVRVLGLFWCVFA